jgi:uroporphyrinogen decarboxylase
MYRAPLSKPQPEFDTLVRVLKGEKQPDKVHLVELGIDGRVMQEITERYLDRKWIPFTPIDTYLGWKLEEGITWQECQKECIDVYHLVGQDFFNVGPTWENLPRFRRRAASDTAFAAAGERHWVEEGGGIIKSWADFEKIPWDKITHNLEALEFTQRNLPEGMKITVAAIMFEMVMERFLGYQDLFLLSYDQPDLVEAVFNEWGRIVYNYYKDSIQYPKVGAIWHVDDLGHKTATILGPEFLRKNVFPWFKKYADLAHENGITCWFHSCGNVYQVIDELIDEIGFDAFHSFQDVIMPVGEFVKTYGHRIAAIGGVDVDKLTRLEEPDLRRYIRGILEQCMPGRFAIGSGNSIASYTPTEKFLIMVDEAMRWQG